MSDDHMPSILESGEKFATAAAKEPRTTVDVEGSLPEGGKPGEATVSISTGGETDRVAWSIGGWFRRKFQPGGNSAGVKGEIKF